MARRPNTEGNPANLRAKPHRDLYEIVGHVTNPETLDVRAVRVIDRAMEAYRLGLGDVDVAARCGVHKETIRAWMRDGTNLSTDLLAGRRTWDSLTKQERKVVDFVRQAAVAETEGKMLLVGLAEKLARGGITQRTVTRKVDSDGNLVEETTRTESTLPDAGMIRWILSHRWRDEYGDRIAAEVTGPAGGPIQVAASLADGLLDEISRLAEARAETDDLLASALAVSNGHGS